jgi:hypothetical protein
VGALVILNWILIVPILVCLIIVVIKMIQDGQTALGIISIFCGIIAFIYGWVKVREWNLMPVMLVWTACIVLRIILTAAVVASANR